MSFYTRYELIDIIQDGLVKTFSARQNGTRQIVAVHLFTNRTLEALSLLEQVRNLGDPYRLEVLEIGEHEGTSYVITSEWKRNQSLAVWAAAATEARAAERFARAGSWRIPTAEFKEKSAGPLDRETGALPVGEFTAMFQSPPRETLATGVVAPSMNPTPPEPEPRKPVPPADPKPHEPEPPAPARNLRDFSDSGTSQEPGEFTKIFQAATQQKDTKGELTRMFEADQLAAARLKQPVNESADEFERLLQDSAPSPEKGILAAEPGEFTQMFRTPTPAQPFPATPPAAAKQEPGEFTRMFQIPVGPQPPAAPSAPVPVSAAPPAVAKQEPGEFTRMFQAPVAPPPGASKQEPGEFTRQFQTPVTPQTALRTAPPLPGPPALQPETGEFTRMFQSPQPVATPRPPVQPSAAPAPPSPPAAAHQEPGEFTRMFQAPAPMQPGSPAANTPRQAPSPSFPTPPVTPAVAQQRPGEFTRMFQAPPGPSGAPVQPAAPPPQQSAPGEFTRFFQAPVAAPGPTAHPAIQNPFGNPPPAPPRSPQAAGEFTQMFGVPSIPPSPLAGAQPSYSPPPSQPSQPPPQQGEGDYTRMFMAPTMQAPGPQASPAPVPATQPPSARPGAQRLIRQPKKKPSYVPLLIILGFVFLIALTAVLFFALKK